MSFKNTEVAGVAHVPPLFSLFPRTSTLTHLGTKARHGSNLTLAQDTEQDYYLHVNRARYKDEARKQRFNIQTVMLIGCYTMLVSIASVLQPTVLLGDS